MTGKRTTWKTEISEETLTAGIIGEGSWVLTLKKKLEERGCTVFVFPTQSSISTKLTYLFVAQDFENAFSLFSKNKFIYTSILLVVPRVRSSIVSRLEFEVSSNSKKNIRLLKVGDILSWDSEKLADTCIWAMLTAHLGKILDLSKESLGIPLKKKLLRSTFSFPSLPYSSSRLSKLFVFALLFLSPLFFVVGIFLFTSYRMYHVFIPLSSGNFVQAREKLPPFAQMVYFQNALSSLISPVSSVPPFSTYKRYVAFSDHALSFSTNALASLRQAEQMKILYGEDSESFTGKQFSEIESSLSRTDESLDVLIADLNALFLPFIDKDPYIQKMEAVSKELKFGRDTLPFLKQILASKGRRTYLVLFQNNTELRPTGGFIGSYGLVTMENGKVASYSFHDVYEADGQLKAHVDPPLPIRDYLNQPHWFLRDSNFDPDFSVSAQQAMWFLEKETGDRVDGVVAVNLNVVSRVLGVLGGVYLPDYSEEVTRDNFLLKATVASQQDFFPGSTAKRDFLQSLGTAIFYTLFDSNSVNYSSLSSAFKESLDKKDILFYFPDPTLQSFIEERGWGGRVVDVSCTSPVCFADFFMAVDANLGVNKANLYVSRRMSIQKNFDEKRILTSTVALMYTNESPAEVFPAGPYKNYLRVFVPISSVINDVFVDNESVLSTIFVSTYGGDKREVGFFVEIPAGASKEISILYSGVVPATSLTYEFFLSKQPGEREGSIDLTFKSASAFGLRPKNFKPTFSDSVYSYTTDSSVDRIFVFDISK